MRRKLESMPHKNLERNSESTEQFAKKRNHSVQKISGPNMNEFSKGGTWRTNIGKHTRLFRKLYLSKLVIGEYLKSRVSDRPELSPMKK